MEKGKRDGRKKKTKENKRSKKTKKEGRGPGKLGKEGIPKLKKGRRKKGRSDTKMRPLKDGR